MKFLARKRIGWSLTLIFLACSIALALPAEKRKLLPPKGKTLIMASAGSNSENIEVLQRVTGYTSKGHKAWVDLDNPDHVKVHTEMKPYNECLMVTLLFGGIPKGKELAPQAEKLTRVTSGARDEALESFAKELRLYDKPVYLDIGCEAEFFYPDHPKEFVETFRYVQKKLKPLCGEKVLYFWHTSFGPNAERWYPGDDFVDGIGLSLYNDHQFQAAEPVVQYAKRHKLSVGILEMGLAPHEGTPNMPASDSSWKGYYLRIFNFVDRHDISFIGYQGNSEEVFHDPGPFHHNRIDYLSPAIQKGWKDMMKRPRYRH
jgi:hypothetical protein